MNKVTSFTKANVSNVALEIVKVLNAHFADKNLNFSRGAGSFDANTFTLKVTAAVVCSATGEALLSPIESAYEDYRASFPLPPLGTTFVSKGRAFKIAGFKSSGRKYPVLCTSLDNPSQTYKFTVDSVNSLCK